MSLAIDCRNVSEEDYEKVFKNPNVNSSLLAKVLASRGIVDEDDVLHFLYPDMDCDWENPYDIKGMDALADKVEEAIKSGKRILIYGDYDLDGISATAVMLRGLRELDKHSNVGMTLDYFIPDRFSEGYGFSEEAINRMLANHEKPDLIISVDCGVTAANEIKLLRENEIDVVITDHHEKSDNFPTDVELIDPAAEENDNSNKILAGVGVALKLICVLSTRFGMPNMWEDLIEFAALGTLADIMPLIWQNRALVSNGLKILNKNPRPCVRALLDVAGKSGIKMTAKDISYVIVPRLNAAGRLAKPELALELLLTDDYTEAYNLAIELEDLNNQRRDLTEQIFIEANYQAGNIIENNPNQKSLVLAKQGWHPGVLGIVASKIVDTYHIPAIVLSIEDGVAHGSGRSVGEIDLHDACMNSFDKFLKFGGHKGACGISINVGDMDEFSQSLDNYMQNLDASIFHQKLYADVELFLHDLNVADVESLEVMEPFGNANEEPVFMTKNVFIKRARAVGANKNHLSCNLTDGAYGAQGIMFNVDNIEKYLKCDGTVTTIYNAKTEDYQGQRYVKMFLGSVIPSEDLKGDDSDASKSEYIDSLFNSSVIKDNKNASIGDFIKTSVREYNTDIVEKNLARHNNDENLDWEIREKLKELSIDDLQQAIVDTIVCEGAKLHDSQKQSLDLLKEGKSVLSVMPTGRGKSLIFQVYSALLAIKENKMSLFVFPLRALIADQAFHLQNSLGKLGMKVCVLTGDTFSQDRNKIYEQIARGEVDIVLTTPEFLSYHIDQIAINKNFGFVVVDEAHHLGQVKLGERSTYGHMSNILEQLKHPQVLAVSATVNDDICKDIKTYLPIQEIVYDNFERKNLYVDDRRNIKCRDDYLISLCASGQKIVIYVNSRQQTVDLARVIRSRAPHIAMKVGFYNGGMRKDDRNKIEHMFRNNDLSVLVTTSAFGEGVDIPDIRHVCLYHLPFSNVEFNQMAGRCGRDNNPAIVHLLYNRADATINTQILEMKNPGHDVLSKIYMWIKSSCQMNEDTLEFSHDNLIKMHNNGMIPADPGAVLCAIDIFDELGLINVKTFNKQGDTCSKIALCEVSERVNLEDSSRFCEGQNEISNFEDYRQTAMRRTARDLTSLLRHPILPFELIN